MHNRDVLIKVDHVSKKFSRDLKKSLRNGLSDVTRSFFGLKITSNKLRKDEFLAVKDISFELRRGECLGLIGHNGAGKSTLLKMLNGLIRPDTGTITMHGRISALIELGAGFNPILTGRENIYVNGQILGFSKKEIDLKLNSIIEFSEIGQFIDSPVQNYSSGMKVRLGFAIAAQMEPDILIIDEVLAVGDVGFRIKCYNHIQKILNNCAVIFVSHSMPAIGRICTSAILMNRGEIGFQSEKISLVVEKYNKQFDSKSSVSIDMFSNLVQFKGVEVNGLSKTEIDLEFNKVFNVDIHLASIENLSDLVISLVFIDREEKIIASTRSLIFSIKKGDFNACFSINNRFATGEYATHIVIAKKDEDSFQTLIRCGSAIRFSIVNCPVVNASPILLESEFKID